jgi:N-acyl-D-aspartate/D-glutamate deacylase
MLDVVIKGGTVIDGTGTPGVLADVAVHSGRVVAIVPPGAITEPAAETIDATGLLVTPGIVDPHTHYDAQLIWDPAATPSLNHGVTSVIGGNCGFTLAPIRAVDADYTRRMMAKVEGMPLAALEQGIEWNWETFGDYLNRLDGNIGVNAGFLVGHCALRRYVMGEEAVGNAATADQISAMQDELARSIEAGDDAFEDAQRR